MQRRRALLVAGTLTAALALAGGAMAANLGILGSDSSTVGAATVQPAASERPHRPRHTRQRPRVRVIVQDIPVATGGGSSGTSGGSVESAGSASPAVLPAPAPAPAPAAPPVVDDGYDDDGDDAFDDHPDDDGGDHGDDQGDVDHPEEPDDD